jgi:hypothetical protein
MFFKCFQKTNIVDLIKQSEGNDDLTSFYIMLFLDKYKHIHPVANMHYNNLISHPTIRTPSMYVQHDNAIEWIIQYHKNLHKTRWCCLSQPIYY